MRGWDGGRGTPVLRPLCAWSCVRGFQGDFADQIVIGHLFLVCVHA